MRKLSLIQESVWSDIQDRSTGDIVRKEDHVDLLEPQEFFVYLQKYYVTSDGIATNIYIVNDDEGTDIDICLFEDEHGYYTYLIYTFPNTAAPYIVVTSGVKEISSELYDIMENKYKLGKKESVEEIYTTVEPKNGSKITNTFFLDVLDCLIENIPNPSIKKK